VSGSGISWAICKSALRSRQITTPVPHHSVFLQAGCPSCRPTNSVKHWRLYFNCSNPGLIPFINSSSLYSPSSFLFGSVPLSNPFPPVGGCNNNCLSAPAWDPNGTDSAGHRYENCETFRIPLLFPGLRRFVYTWCEGALAAGWS